MYRSIIGEDLFWSYDLDMKSQINSWKTLDIETLSMIWYYAECHKSNENILW
jgi:hypothetical protein